MPVWVKETAERAFRIAGEANRAKSSFLSNMSRSIRTPMNAVIGFAAPLAREYAHELCGTGRKHEQGMMDKAGLNQILRNLLSNAVEYAPDGGYGKGLVYTQNLFPLKPR